MNQSESITFCKRCLMDSTEMNFSLDKYDFCNYCNDYLKSKNREDSLRQYSSKEFENLLSRIKKSGKNKKYDCIVGVSGGVDSSWGLKIVKDFGLRPLAVHMDNGWNSELAQNNISNLVTSLGIDLYTHVINWDEYRNLMQSFFDSDVVDVELLYDNAMLATNYKLAKKFGVKYILGGTNTATEGMSMPENWNWFKYDKKNIKSIAQIFGKQKLITFPSIGIIGYLIYEYLFRINWVSILDYIEYDKNEAIDALSSKYNYKPYPYKHYESVFTRFYQGYILPNKFGIDKRKLHLSSLIVNGITSRDEGLKDLKKIPYPSEKDLKEDIEYFLKKMNWKNSDLVAYLNRPRKEHDFYPSSKSLWEFLKKINKFLIRNIRVSFAKPNR